MSMIETVDDVNNLFLSRREITCNFRGLGGKLKKSEAVSMITKEFKLDGKTVIAINLKHHTGRPNILGTFYIYDDESLAKKQVSPVIFERLDKQKTKDVERSRGLGDVYKRQLPQQLFHSLHPLPFVCLIFQKLLGLLVF